MTAPNEDWLADASLAPDPGGSLAPLYAAALTGRLAMPFCGRCRAALELDQEVCDGCGVRHVVWEPVPLSGVVHTVTTVHRRQRILIRAEAPYPVIDVELSSGHRMVVTTDRPAAAPRIGQSVRIGFRRVGAVAVPAVMADDSSDDYHQEVTP